MRKLATIRKINELFPIKGADRIEGAVIDGWECVVKKGEFEVGDLCVYFEIDSILPVRPWSEFMEPRKYRVRTAKFKGQIAQGLALPVSMVFPETRTVALDEDVTEELGVRKYDPEAEKEQKVYDNPRKKRPWWAKSRIGMKIYLWLHPRLSKKGWPEWLPKTDETRVQNIRNLEKHIANRYLYATEKLDGQSFTMYYNHNEKAGLFKKGVGGVCSRNIHYPFRCDNNWWNYAVDSGDYNRFENYCKTSGKSLALQGELIGPGIQGNKYNLSTNEMYAFNVWDINKQKYLNLEEKLIVLSEVGIVHVPFLSDPNDLTTPKEFLEFADGPSLFVSTEHPREGVVIRDWDDDGFSFKAISNQFLLLEDSFE